MTMTLTMAVVVVVVLAATICGLIMLWPKGGTGTK